MNSNLNGKVANLDKADVRCKTFALLSLFLLLISLPACATISSPSRPQQTKVVTSVANYANLTAWVDSTLATHHPQAKLKHRDRLARLYQLSDFNNFWFDNQGQLNPAARLLLNDLKPWLALDYHPRLEAYQQLAELLQQPVNTNLPRHRQATDLLISDLFLSYQDDLLQGYWTKFDQDQDHGITNAYESWDNWPDEVVRKSLEEVFPTWLQKLKGQQPAVWAVARIQETQPISSLYLPWRQAFAELEAMAALGDWPQVDSYLMLGSRNAEVTRLALQLERQGDLTNLEHYLPTTGEQPLFDKQLELALKSFQYRHQLKPTGSTNKVTRRQLNLPPKERLRLLAHNMRRLHHLPKTLNQRHLMINMADQRLAYVEQDQLKLDMKIVIGRDGLRTPIINQWLTSIVLNPLWNVPDSIARERIFPRALQNPEYFSSRDYALVDGWHTPSRFVGLDEVPKDAFEREKSSYRIVQKTGNHNQLGKAKFRLSNQQAIYLHDTPNRQVFNRDNRDISSGCVRLEDADQLVIALLNYQGGFNEEKINQIYQQGEERYLQVRPRVAVYLMYWSVWTDKAGRLHWREDIYNKDSFKSDKRLAFKP